MDERLKKAGIHAERVLLEIGRVGFSDISKLYKEGGILKLPEEWDQDTKAAISGVECFEEFEEKGENRINCLRKLGFQKRLKRRQKHASTG